MLLVRDIATQSDCLPANWMPLTPNAEFIQIREYHRDFASHRAGLFDIQRLDAPPVAPPPSGPAEIADKLEKTLAWAQKYGPFHRASQQFIFPKNANALNPPKPMKGGNSHIWYGFGRFALSPEEAMVLSFDKPEARLWSVQWLLDPWYENPDLLGRLTGIVGNEAEVTSDGRVRIVFAAQDPGVRNWLDVSGYPRGLFVTRWIWCEQGPPTGIEVVPFADLRDHLPADTAPFTPEQRAEQRARRRTHFVHRRR